MQNNQLDKQIRFASDGYKDWTIYDFDVTQFGADPANHCNTQAFQDAIDTAYKSGGGVVYIPAGIYAFRTESTAVRNVVSTSGTTAYEYKRVLNLPAGVQLRGDNAVLAVYAGKNSPNYDTYADSDEREGQTNGKQVANVSDRFIDMEQGTGVLNLSVWYPEQDINAESIVEIHSNDGQKTGEFTTIKGIPYPWTFVQRTGNSATLDNVTLINSWGGFIAFPSEMHYIVNCNITALYKGIVVHTCTDIGRIENVRIDPKYWAGSGLPNSPSIDDIRDFTRSNNAVGFQMHRSDWEYIYGLEVNGYNTGMWIGREPGGVEAPNAQFYGLNINDCGTAIYIEQSNDYGQLISNSSFGGDVAVYVSDHFNTVAQFNGVSFNGTIISEATGGVISFEDCDFNGYADSYAIQMKNKGNALVSQSRFAIPDNQVLLTAGVESFKALNTDINITVGSDDTEVQIINDEKYIFAPIPKNIKTDIDVRPKPKSNAYLRLDLPHDSDISASLQEAFDYIKENHGGGTVYLPGGVYILNRPIQIPADVELRGTWDVQHHTCGGGTAIFTTYNGNNSRRGGNDHTGTPLIRLNERSGLRGLSIMQTNITRDALPPDGGFPFLIQGMGHGVYLIDLTIPIADRAIDFASYDTSGHYVDYLGGTVLRAGIWVGGGAKGGFIRNMQFNPHYSTRLPANQGYLPPHGSGNLFALIQGNSSVLLFADVQDQTIFNNFVYGSVFGIHFLKDSVTGNYPGKITMIGHGSDGCTFALYIEDADSETKIIAVNSELVNTNIITQPDRAYVRVGDSPNSGKVHHDSQLVLYNSAFWGSPTTAGAIIFNGNVRFQQANFAQLPRSNPGIDTVGGKAHVYTSYFNPRKDGADNNVYAVLRESGESIELSNNKYNSGLLYKSPQDKPDGIYGSDLE